MTATTTLDAKGLNCPLPILKAKKAISTLEVGDILAIEATDPGAVKDFEAFCRQTGHELLSHEEVEGIFKFQIKRSK
jgi:tRNA 2-thiouridine synthesizing protein A